MSVEDTFYVCHVASPAGKSLHDDQIFGCHNGKRNAADGPQRCSRDALCLERGRTKRKVNVETSRVVNYKQDSSSSCEIKSVGETL